jgi:hypothetical protein
MFMNSKTRRHRSGFTLTELISASAMSVVIAMVVGMLMFVGHRNWLDAFHDSTNGIRVEALETVITFGIMGRKSNKVDYRVYNRQGSTFVRTLPPPDMPEAVVVGQAVEFRYWDVPLSVDLVDTEKTGTAYVLFYLDSDSLKMDYGPYPPGGVDESGNRATGPNVRTRTLANNVISVEFSHTTHNSEGDGNGCVRMNLQLSDPNDSEILTVKAATLMRNTWP